MVLKDKNVLVIGLARSGKAAVKVLKKLGANVFIADKNASALLSERDFLDKYEVTVVEHDEQGFSGDFSLAVKNPGVPYDAPLIRYLKQRGVPVVTEIELAFAVAKPQHYVAVTGTNGKTTTTSLIYEILKRAHPGISHLCGNIGLPLCEVVLEHGLLEEEGHYIALEISNFQLVDIDTFRPEVAVIINLTPDHLDVMGSLDNYYRSKTEVYRNMSGSDTFVLNIDDANILEYTKRYPVGCSVCSLSLESGQADVHISDGFVIYNGEKVLPVEKIKLVGRHNLQNVAVAVACAKSIGVENDRIVDAISGFAGVEHRIEFVRELNGVKYYNDSKGTNTDATITALNAFEKGVILLVGGFEKGLSMDEMKKHLGCVKLIVGFGACGRRLVNDLVGSDGIVVDDLEQAVDIAFKNAAAGDTVLLSPSTSSFDQYSGFEERGRHFKALVNAL